MNHSDFQNSEVDLVTKYLNYKSQFQSVEHKEFLLQLADKTNLIKQEIEKTK
jgi:hypothetical protein